MYFHFKTTDKLGTPNVVDARGSFFSEADRVDGFYSIDVSEYPEYFTEVEDERTKEKRLIPTGFIEGWENLPLKTYDPETKTFADFDPYACAELKKWYRRDHIIQPTLGKQIKPGTEYKKIRRALLAVIDTLADKKLEEHPDIVSFREYCDSVQGLINENPKTRELDLREINGTKKQEDPLGL